MPRIKWISHPNPAKQHLNGTIDYPTREEVAPYLVSGQAELCPAPNFQTHMREAEEIRQRSLSQEPNFVNGVQWCVKERMFSTGTNRAYIERRSGQEVLYGETPDAFKDCPQSVRVQFLKLNRVENPEAAAEKQVQERYRLQAEQQAQRERCSWFVSNHWWAKNMSDDKQHQYGGITDPDALAWLQRNYPPSKKETDNRNSDAVLAKLPLPTKERK